MACLNSAKTNRGRRQRLSATERWLFIQAVVLLSANVLGLRLLGFRRWVSVLAWLAPKRPVRPSSQEEPAVMKRVEQVVRLVAAAARHGPWGGRCLEQSLTLWWLLRWLGITTSVHVGVRKQGKRLEAHAWVEYLGRAINDRQDVDQRFRPLGQIVPAILEPRQ